MFFSIGKFIVIIVFSTCASGQRGDGLSEQPAHEQARVLCASQSESLNKMHCFHQILQEIIYQFTGFSLKLSIVQTGRGCCGLPKMKVCSGYITFRGTEEKTHFSFLLSLKRSRSDKDQDGRTYLPSNRC